MFQITHHITLENKTFFLEFYSLSQFYDNTYLNVEHMYVNIFARFITHCSESIFEENTHTFTSTTIKKLLLLDA